MVGGNSINEIPKKHRGAETQRDFFSGNSAPLCYLFRQNQTIIQQQVPYRGGIRKYSVVRRFC